LLSFTIIPVLAEADPWLTLLASSAAGAGAFLLGTWLAALSLVKRAHEVGLEGERRRRLREGDFVYKHFEPLIDELSRGVDPSHAELERLLAASGTKLPWKPAEFVAVARITGVAMGLALFFVFTAVIDALTGAVFGVAIGFFYPKMSVNAITSAAKVRIVAVGRRLSYAVDLLALLMEAGSGFLESLETVVRENAGTPFAEEMGLVLSQISLGRPRREALEMMRDRMADPDIDEFLFAVIKGEELGTPLAQILRTQADQLRLRRSQHLEKASGEAQVYMVFPGTLIMVACLLIVVAPFVVSALRSGE